MSILTLKLEMTTIFFHITCHVDPNLATKIAKGEFVELDKLLPRPRGNTSNLLEQKTELVFCEGKPIFIPFVDKSRSINNVRRWERAFRIYAAIYS